MTDKAKILKDDNLRYVLKVVTLSEKRGRAHFAVEAGRRNVVRAF